MKYMNKTLMLMAAALMAFSACDKWTETEPVNVVYETLESKNPDLYAKYLQSLRDYHASAHQVLIAKFDNKGRPLPDVPTISPACRTAWTSSS